MYAIAQKPIVKHIPQVLKTDSSALNTHYFNNTALQNYSKQKVFRYDSSVAVGVSFWERFWSWIWKKTGDFFGRIFANKSSWFLFRLVLFVVAGGALVYMILRIAGIDVIGLFMGRSKNIELPYTESLEDIHAINFDTEIDNAVSGRNYRLAVRLLYLRSLKQLSDAQLIHWQIEKTNSSYITELGDTEYRRLFGLLTTRFEYVWYGDFPIDGQAFQNINSLFIDFKKGLP